jgi:hypothetical protein
MRHLNVKFRYAEILKRPYYFKRIVSCTFMDCDASDAGFLVMK